MGKTLQDRIKNLSGYKPDISFTNNMFILKIMFKDGWTVIQPENTDKIAFAKDKSTKCLYWYVSSIEDADSVFDLIEDTIAVNKELEKKIELYKLKIHELQELFLSNESYERLSTLEFVIPNKQRKKQSKPKKTVGKSNSDIVGGMVDEQKTSTPTETVSEIDRKINEVTQNI